MRRFATVLLVDRRGWLLLQERDEHAPIDPDCWGLVGGHIEPGEGVEDAVHRELAEETGLTGHQLTRWRRFTVHDEDEMTVFVGPTTVTDADVVCGEGRQIVFVEPGATSGLRLTRAARVVVPAFLASPEYASLLS